MLAYLKGKLAQKTSDWAIVEVGGVGYRIFMPSGNLSTIGNIGASVQVFTHLQVREDMLNLYGFLHEEELRFFEMLVQVSGIGPKGALGILGAFPVSLLQRAIAEENIAMLSKAPGIGKKTAQRIVLELREKISKIVFNLPYLEERAGAINTNFQDALEAMESLGYSLPEANRVINESLKKLGEDAPVEELIKLSLKQLTLTNI
ncbi:MAG: Holliday junction branch migration protein RuvA [Clostridia bacterium]|nr:Holliday junction branch migration protein RuvA [Clostridia bacterium]